MNRNAQQIGRFPQQINRLKRWINGSSGLNGFVQKDFVVGRNGFNHLFYLFHLLGVSSVGNNNTRKERRISC